MVPQETRDMSSAISRRQLLALITALITAPIPALTLTALARAADIGGAPQDIANLGAPDAALEKKIADLALGIGLNRVGFAAVDLANGRTAFLREGELFPMQSLCKLPIAIAFMYQVEQGKANLNRKVRLTAADIVPGRSPLAARLRAKPTNFTAQQLIEHMLLNSDNTATDALMKLAGGPAKIQAVLKKIDGLDGLRIDRYERDLQPEAVGLRANANYADPEKFDAAIASLGARKQRAALQRFIADPRDSTSPRAFALLYFKLLSGHLLDMQHATFLLDLMRRTKTGADRLNAGMPPGWTFAHRGGQSKTIQGISAAFNDSGLATHRKGAKIVIVLLVEGATLETARLADFHRAVAGEVLEAWK